MNNEIKYLKNALDLIVKYTQDNETIRENLQKKGYDGKPLFFYIPILIAHSPEYRKYYNQTFNAPIASAKDQTKFYLKKILKGTLGAEEGDLLKAFFTKCLKNTTIYNGLRQETRPLGLFSQSQLQQIESYSQLPLNAQKVDFFNQIIVNFSKSQNTYVPYGGFIKAEEKAETAEQFKEDINKELVKIKDKDIKYVEKSHPKTSPEAVKRLEEILAQPTLKIPTTTLTDIHGQPLRVYTPPSIPSIPSISVPSIHVPEVVSGALKTGVSEAQITTGGFLKGTLPRILSGGSKGILKGLGFGGKAIVGMGAKAGLAATGVGAPIAIALMAPTIIKKSTQILKYTAITIGAIIFFFLFNDVNQKGLFFSPGTSGETAPLPPGSGGGSCPDTSTNTNGFSCKYLNPSIDIFDTNISQTAISNYINNYSGIFNGGLGEFTNRVNYIIDKSKQGGLNPALFLGYWKTESLFSTIGSRDMGCVGNGFYEQVRCALAVDEFSDPGKNPVANCARSKNAGSVACVTLKSIRSTLDKTHPINYPIKTFDDFAEAYGPYDDLTGGLPTNCISTYNKLIEVAKELGVCQSTPIIPPSGNLAKSISDKYHIVFDPTIDQKYLNWAWEILATSETTAPNFLPILQKRLADQGYSQIYIKTTPGVSERVGNIIYFSTNPGSFFTIGNSGQFKQLFIHELTHSIHGTRGDNTYTNQIAQAIFNDKKIISGYAQGATAGETVCYASNSGEIAVQYDEDFADSISYYINKDVPELNYSSVCPARNSSQNPFASNSFPSHLFFIKQLLGGNNF